MSEGLITALLSGFFAMAGVALGQFFSKASLDMQLKHTSEEQTRAREYQSKKEVYLDLVASYARFVTDVTNIQNRDLTSLLLTDIQVPLTTSIAKAQLVATEKTSLLLDSFSVEVQGLLQKITLPLLSAYEATLDLKTNVGLYDELSKEQEITLQEMKKLHLHPDENFDYRISVLSKRFEDAHTSMEKLMAERRELIRAEKDAKVDYARVAFGSIIAVSKDVLNVIRALREELGYSLSDADIEAKMEKIAASQEALEVFLKELEGRAEIVSRGVV